MNIVLPYICSKCGVSGVKLWRQYQTIASAIELLCVDCAEADQKKKLNPGCDQIGWLVPAVPVDGEPTYWGYTSVPPEGCKWWYDLPMRKTCE